MKKSTLLRVLFVVSRMRLELTWYNHTPLKRTRLPIPPPRRLNLPCERACSVASVYIIHFFYDIVKRFIELFDKFFVLW